MEMDDIVMVGMIIKRGCMSYGYAARGYYSIMYHDRNPAEMDALAQNAFNAASKKSFDFKHDMPTSMMKVAMCLILPSSSKGLIMLNKVLLSQDLIRVWYK